VGIRRFRVGHVSRFLRAGIGALGTTLNIAFRFEGSLAPEQSYLRLAQGFRLSQFPAFAQTVETFHQLRRAGIRHRPQGGHHRFRALALGDEREAIHFPTIRAFAAPYSGLAGRQREQVDAAEQVVLPGELRQRDRFASSGQ